MSTPRATPSTLADALSFVQIAAIFQLADGAQAALSNMLRGVQDSRAPMALALVGYWLSARPWASRSAS